MSSLYPLTFEPVLKAYIWGGRNLATRLGRRLPSDGPIAESWEVAAHPDGDARIANGRFAGLTLSALHAQLGLDLIGRYNAWAQERGKFPLLVKLLDAQTTLSVQVHPDDAYALAHEGNELGKTEMWVILHAEPGAQIILGVRAGVTAERLRCAAQLNDLEPCLHRLPVRAGDHVCVPAGTLHAIQGGILLAEIQQNSNTTYRVYDWGRLDRDGRPRPLHLERALDAIDFSRVEPSLQPAALLEDGPGWRRWSLCRNRYFTVERIALEAGRSWRGVCDGRSLEIWGALSGRATVTADGSHTVDLAGVQFTLLPAALGRFRIDAHTPVTLLRTYVEEIG